MCKNVKEYNLRGTRLNIYIYFYEFSSLLFSAQSVE